MLLAEQSNVSKKHSNNNNEDLIKRIWKRVFCDLWIAKANKIIPLRSLLWEMGNTFYQGVVLEKRRAESKAHKKTFKTVENFLLIYSHLKTTLIVLQICQ